MKNAVTNSSRSSVTLRVLSRSSHSPLGFENWRNKRSSSRNPDSFCWMAPLSVGGLWVLMGCPVLGWPTRRAHGGFGRWFSGLGLQGVCVISSPHFLARIQLAGDTGDSWPSRKPRRKMKWEFVNTLSYLCHYFPLFLLCLKSPSDHRTFPLLKCIPVLFSH